MYIEEVFLLNFVIDYIIFYMESLILKTNIKNKRIIFTSLVGELSIILLFLNINYLYIFILKFIFGLLLILICFGYKDLKSYIEKIIWFYSLSFMIGGFLYYFKLNIKYYIYYISFIPVILNIFKYFLGIYKKNINLKYKVNIYLNDGSILYLDGFMDSGNSLKDLKSNKNIIIIDKLVNEEYKLIYCDLINTSSFIKCFEPKKVYIEGLGIKNDLLVGVINKKFNGYNCLLNYNLMEE